MRKDFCQQTAARCVKQPRSADSIAIAISAHQIYGTIVVELIDLQAVGLTWQRPTKSPYKDLVAQGGEGQHYGGKSMNV
jgi:hypothetical protein